MLGLSSGGGHTYFDVLVVYVVSPVADLLDKNRNSSKKTYDASGQKYRIKLCREAFASIDDVNPNPNEIKLARDGNHLSKNMFVWPDENDSANEIGQLLSSRIPVIAHNRNVTFYGLAGSDKVITEEGKTPIRERDKYYFLNGIDGNSIIVGRGDHDLKNVFTAFNPSTVDSLTPPLYDPINGKIPIETDSTVSSTNIQPQILGLSTYLKSIVAQGQYTKSITNTSCNNANKDVSNCIPYTEQDNHIEQIRQFVQRIPVPHSILFKLITYDENPQPSITTNDKNMSWCGYKEFRRYLFRQAITNIRDQHNEVNRSKTITQRQYDTGDKSPLIKKENVKSKTGTIEFLQMTSGHALFIQGDNSVRTSVLNFANPRFVGGGVWYGSWVQEETLCMMSPHLYLSLENLTDKKALSPDDTPTPRRLYENTWGENKWNSRFLYTDNRCSVFYTTDEFTFTPTLPAPWIQQTDPASGKIFYANTQTKDTQWDRPLRTFQGHVISAAAYDWRNKPNPSGYAAKKNVNNSMIRMIQHMAFVAATQQNCDVLVLGAWGCGAFAPKNDRTPVPGYIEHVARLFCKALYTFIPGGEETDRPVTYKELFTKVIFPIPDCNTYDIFKGAFDAQETEIVKNGGGLMAKHVFEDEGGEGVLEGDDDDDDDDASFYSEDNEKALLVSNASKRLKTKKSIAVSGSGSTAAVNPGSTPYITITNMIAGIDSGIDHFVEQVSNRNPLREISVNEQGVTTNQNKEIPKFSRVDGDFPKSTVPLFEQMVYHRAGSMNLNPLAIFIPTGYKVNFQEINEYFREMTRRNDPETQELMALVINAYGNNNNTLFYKHTLPGKVSTAGARPVMVGGAYPAPNST